MFCVAAQDARVILKTAACGGKGVANANIDVFVIGVSLEVFAMFRCLDACQHAALRRFVVHHDLGSWHMQDDADMKSPSVLMMCGGSFDDNAATGDAVEKVLKGGDLLKNARLDSGGDVHVTESDLWW